MAKPLASRQALRLRFVPAGLPGRLLPISIHNTFETGWWAERMVTGAEARPRRLWFVVSRGSQSPEFITHVSCEPMVMP